MKKYVFGMALAVLALTSQPSVARDCDFVTADDRQAIKNSVPNGALNQTPQLISLESLMDSTNPPLSKAQKKALEDRRWGGRLPVSNNNGEHVSLRDGDMITVEGFLYQGRCQTDGDWHLEIGTLSTRETGPSNKREQSPCWIIEAPDPDRIDNADLKTLAEQVRVVIDRLPDRLFNKKASGAPVSISITGPLFLDVHHIEGRPSGGRGTKFCATNVWEIHPITNLTILDRAPVIGPN